MSQFDEVIQAKALSKGTIMARPNVVGMGVGYKVDRTGLTDELSVVVLVRNKVPLAALSPESLIPQEVSGGVRTDVMEVGFIRPLMAQSRTDRWRPAPGGVSLGHYKITAGTLGYVVRDKKTGKRLILSNNHVLANVNEANPGDPILQPGPADGGEQDLDTIAYLDRFYPIRLNAEPATCSLAKNYARFGNAVARLLGSAHQLQVIQAFPSAYNLIDAAVARPVDDSMVQEEDLEIGAITGVKEAELGMAVRKSGRTTAFTTGEINVLDATVMINYGLSSSATFEHQIVSTPMSAGGDSGSLLVAKDAPLAVGLLFAGSDQTTIFNPIQTVCEMMEIEFHNPDSEDRTARQEAVKKVQDIKEAYQNLLMAKPNVVGVGVGLRHKGGQRTNDLGLVVMVQKKLPKAMLAPNDLVPEEIEGVPVDVREVGKLEAY